MCPRRSPSVSYITFRICAPSVVTVYISFINKFQKVQMRKLIPCMKHLTFAERLSYLNFLALHYGRLRGDMIMVFTFSYLRK